MLLRTLTTLIKLRKSEVDKHQLQIVRLRKQLSELNKYLAKLEEQYQREQSVNHTLLPGGTARTSATSDINLFSNFESWRKYQLDKINEARSLINETNEKIRAQEHLLTSAWREQKKIETLQQRRQQRLAIQQRRQQQQQLDQQALQQYQHARSNIDH